MQEESDNRGKKSNAPLDFEEGEKLMIRRTLIKEANKEDTI